MDYSTKPTQLLSDISVDTLAIIISYIDSDCIARLYEIGNIHLRIKLNASVRSLDPTSPRSLIFFFGYFTNLHTVCVHAANEENTINSSLAWPHSLQKLTISNFTRDSWLDGPFPSNLRLLHLKPSKFYFEPKLQVISHLWRENGLPPTLTSLSLPTFGIKCASTSHLPRSLCDLSISYHRNANEPKCTFQETLDFLVGLPQGLHRLYIFDILVEIIATNPTNEELALLLNTLPNTLQYVEKIDTFLTSAGHLLHLPRSLTKLKLGFFTPVDVPFIHNLPSTLTYLSFDGCNIFGKNASSFLDDTLKLPWSLTRLKLSAGSQCLYPIISRSILPNLCTVHLDDYHNRTNGPLPVLPPNVTDLRISSIPEAYWIFPTNLKRFTLDNSIIRSNFEWIERVPRTVERIYIRVGQINKQALKMFDNSFTALYTLHIGQVESTVTNEDLLSLSQSIRELVLDKINVCLDLKDLFSKRANK
jgi:hypothetical protein